MRRMLRPFALLLLAVLPWASPALGQTTFGMPGPGGVIQYSDASTTCTNTAVSCQLYSYTIPFPYVATAPNTNATPPVNGSVQLHLILAGNISTNASPGQIGSVEANVTYGSGASLTLVNNSFTFPVAASNAPWRLDVWLNPIATAITSNTVWMSGRITFYAAASTVEFNGQVVGTTALNIANTLTANFRWSSATNSNALNVYQQQLLMGN